MINISGLHFDSETYDQISFVNTVNGAEVSWPLGKITVERDNLVWLEGDYEATISAVSFSVLIIFGLAMVGLGAGAMFMFYRRSNDRILRKV